MSQPAPHYSVNMRRRLAFALVFFALSVGDAGDVVAQVADETLVPRGRLRLQFNPSFTSWGQRFGEYSDAGTLTSGKEDLGSDLTDEAGTGLFPAVADLESHLRALSGNATYSGVLGATSGRVSQDVTRIDLGAHLGVFDWLTVGVVAPLVKTHTSVDLAVRQNGVASDLGLNPAVSDASAVASFLNALSTVSASASAQAGTLCAVDPASVACGDAQSLADRVNAFHASSEGAYLASAFFPLEGSAIAQSLSDVATALDGDLSEAGLGGIGGTMLFATDLLSEESLADAPTTGGFGIQGSRLEGLNTLWALGDVEVSALAHILDGEVRDSGAVAPRMSYSLAGGLMVRLGTGSVDQQDVFLDLGTGDGQMDIEARLLAFVGLGPRLGVHVAARYGMQQSLDLLRRVAPPELVMAPAHTVRAVRWSPGAYLGIDLAPQWHLSPTLSILGSYGLYAKGDDSYQMLGDDPEGSPPADVGDLERESGVTVHRAGLGLRYSTVEPWRAGETSRPLEMQLRAVYSIAGSGGHTPVATRIEFGIRLFRGIWGGSPAAATASDTSLGAGR
ncbi:MAG TPA: hypothetical protein EYQ02_11055 [Microbacterium sp.]|nr:hypothetical protein [Microbacterium sp.]